MAKWQSTCICGDTMDVEANSKEEAIDKTMAMMTPDSISAHMAEKHSGQPVPSQEETRAGVESTIHEV